MALPCASDPANVPAILGRASLSVRFLCLPKGDPEQPLQAGLPSFATANLVFEAKLIASLDRLPLTTDAHDRAPRPRRSSDQQSRALR
jgi:hypothetical protein